MTLRLSAETLHQVHDAIKIPTYDRSLLSPGILHVGVGNFHRAHMGVYMNMLFEKTSRHDWGIIGAGVHPNDALMRERLLAQDNLTCVVDLAPTGPTARITGSMIDFLPIEPSPTITGMADPRIRIVSLTVTEGGYFLNTDGSFHNTHPEIIADSKTPSNPKTVFGMILAALRLRRAAGVAPFTVLSCDNLPGNGAAARQTILGLAKLSDPDFATWVGDTVAFPNSMVDGITPATTERERALVRDQFGLEDAAPVVCEPFRQWVIEDDFPSGRPPLEDVGVTFAKNVDHYELMKLRILNASHASISYAAALLGHHFIHDAIADPDISAWLHALQTREIIPTLPTIAGVDYATYLSTVITRFQNPAIGDTIPRNAASGSDRQPKFILPALRDTLQAGGGFSGLALEIALWARYLQGRDEVGKLIEIEDVIANDLCRRAQEARTRPLSFLENTVVFGELAANQPFADAFSKWLTLLENSGTRATLQIYYKQAETQRP